MQAWSITLHGPSGAISSFSTGEAEFVVGSETAADVLHVSGEGVQSRHAIVSIRESRMKVEDLGGGTLVNGHRITGRVETTYPASVQMGDVTLVVEASTEPVDWSTAETIVTGSGPHGAPVGNGSTVNVQDAVVGVSYKAPVVSEYTLVREIARGGMGQIYFGEDPQLKRQVAVKVSSLAYGGEDPRFTKEAEVLAHLAHPNIVPIYNIGVDAQGRPFYSMKLIKGRTLQAVLNLIREGDAAAVKDYPRSTLLTVFRKVCDAMAFAHSERILHRDLKPENIMVGKYGEVLVMDWGLAKVLGEQESRSAGNAPSNDTGDYGMTMEGEVMGTPQYMSPEQAEGMVAELDQRSDIYSLGGILYAILTLRPPIDGKTLDEVLTKVKSGSISAMATKRGGKDPVEVGSPSAMETRIPEALQAVTLKAMSRDRNKRYGSVEAFAGDIERYQNGFATSAEDAGAWKRINLWVGRNKVLAASAAVLVVVVSGFTARVVQKGREASEALAALREMAPMAASKSKEEAEAGNFEEALKTASYAVELQRENKDFRVGKANVLQLMGRWEEALREYELCAGEEGVEESIKLTRELMSMSDKEKAQARSQLLHQPDR